MIAEIKPKKGLMLGELIVEEEVSSSGIISHLGRSNVNPHIVKIRVINDSSIHDLKRDDITLCRFIGLQDVTGDNKFFFVHEGAIEAIIE